MKFQKHKNKKEHWEITQERSYLRFTVSLSSKPPELKAQERPPTPITRQKSVPPSRGGRLPGAMWRYTESMDRHLRESTPLVHVVSELIGTVGNLSSLRPVTTHSAIRSVLAYRPLPRTILHKPEVHLGCARVLWHCCEWNTESWGIIFNTAKKH